MLLSRGPETDKERYMKRIITILFILAVSIAASAQIPIRIPKPPKIPKLPPTKGDGNSGDFDPNETVYENKNAPADYDANIQPGQIAAAFEAFDLQDVEIVRRKGNIYEGRVLDGRRITILVKANSVYPFKISDYDRIWLDEARSIHGVILFLLDLYAKKHGLEGKELYSGGAYKARYSNDFVRMKADFDKTRPEFARVRDVFKSRIPQRPNTYLKLDENPGMLADILDNHEEYMATALGEITPVAGKCGPLSDADKMRVESHTEGMQKLLDQVKTFTRDRNWYSGQQYEEYFLAAISPRRRSQMENNTTKYGTFYPCLVPLLDQIQTEAKKTLPNYTLLGYNTRSPADERVLRSAINDLNKATVFKIGLQSNVWNIQKNVLGIPEKRYKHGAIWVKYPNVDHGFCQILWINVIQDYAGGGTYGQSYGYFTRNEPAGCPAGK